MEKAELMQEKLEKQRQLPNDIKDKLNTTTFINLIISILFMIYMIAVNLLFINENEVIFSNSIKASAITFAVIDIIIFEIAYRKESINIAIHAIELLCVSFFILLIPYIYFYVTPLKRGIIMFMPVFFSIYYIVKLIVIHIIEANKYINNLSDVKEILQENTENEGYLDEITLNSEDNNIDINAIDDIQEINKKINEEKKIIKETKK